MKNKFVTSNGILEEAIDNFNKNKGGNSLTEAAFVFHLRINEGGSLLVPVEPIIGSADKTDKGDDKISDSRTGKLVQLKPALLELSNGEKAYSAFTDRDENNAWEVTLAAVKIDEYFRYVLRQEGIVGVIVNPFGAKFVMPKKLIELILSFGSDVEHQNEVFVERSDITKSGCECIVNAANSSLLGGGGVDGAIHRTAGPELLKECHALNGCKTGQAKITRAYKLKANYVIHTVGPVYSGSEQDGKLLANCYWNSLQLAKRFCTHSIAFPAISTGVYGYPPREAAEIAARTVFSWLAQNENYGMQVVFSCIDKKIYDIYKELVALF